MCNVDDAELVEVIREPIEVTARKTHKCAECCRDISKGERHFIEVYKFDRRLTTDRCCLGCKQARIWLSNECGGWVYGGVWDDLQEHWVEECTSLTLHRLIVGMRKKWRTRKGKLMRVSKIAEGSHA